MGGINTKIATQAYTKKVSRRKYKNHDVMDQPGIDQNFGSSFNGKPNFRMTLKEPGFTYKLLKLTKDKFEVEFYDAATGLPKDYAGEFEWEASPKDDDLE